MKHMKMMSVLLAGTIAFSTALPTFADAKDVAENYWAKEIIESVVEEDLMALYEGDKFVPGGEATHLEAVVVLYRAAEKLGYLEDLSMGTLTTHYEDMFEEIGIPKMLAPYGSDVYPAMAYAIENGVITPEEAKTFVKDGKLTQINKVTMSVFAGRALNFYKEENLNRIAVLSYKDAESVPVSARRYVHFLIENEIISPKGDAKGNFNPSMPLTRAVLAVFVEGYYDALSEFEKNDDADDKDDSDDDADNDSDDTASSGDTTLDKGDVVFKGSVQTYNADNNTMTVKGPSSNEVFSMKHVPVYFGGKEVGINHVAKASDVTVYVKSGLVTKVEVNKVYDVVEGTFSNIGPELTVEPSFRSFRTRLEDKTFDHKRLYDGAIVTINEAPAKVEDLEEGDRVFVYHDGHTIKRVVAYTGEFEVSGIMTGDFDDTKDSRLSFVTENGFVYNYNIGENAALINRSEGFEKDAIVSVRLQNGVVTRLENTGKKETLLGTLTGIHIKAEPEISIKTEKGERTFAVSDKALFLNEEGEPKLSIYDLRLSQGITVYTGFSGVYKVQLGQIKEVDKEASVYTVTQVFESAGILTVVDDDGQIKTIVFKTDSDLKLSDYSVGDRLLIEGKTLTKDVIEAAKISLKK